MEHIIKFNLFEGRIESKKSKSDYFTKRVPVTKLDLGHICEELGLPFDQLKFLSSGAYGNAYKIGDRVLKITSDKKEAKSVYDIIQKGQKKGVVNYYDILRYKLGKGYVFVILMDYVTPLDKYANENIKDSDIMDYLFSLCDIIHENWRKIKSKDEFYELIEDKYEVPESGFTKVITDKLWTLYNKIKGYTEDYPDIHPYNMGLKSDGSLVLFDFADLGTVRKFDQPRIIPMSKFESVNLK